MCQISAQLWDEIVEIPVLDPGDELMPFVVAIREDGPLGLLGIGDEDRLAIRGYLDARAAVASQRGAPDWVCLTTSISNDSLLR